MRLIRRSVALLAAAPFALAAAADADDLRATSAIDSVLVFPASADVTRLGEIRLPAGEHRVIFPGLPEGLNADSLRVRFGDPGVVVGAVEAVPAYPEDGGPDEGRRLMDEIQALNDRIQAVDDRIAVAELQLRYLESQAAGPKGEEAQAAHPGEWPAALEALASGGLAARQAILAAQQERRALERALEALELEQEAWDDDLTLRTDVVVSLSSESAVTTALVLEYQVADAAWSALYEARLDSAESQLTLERKIKVAQNTGEDWRGVQLAVSTAPPTDQLEAPTVWSQYLSLQPPGPPPPPPSPAPMARGLAYEEALDGLPEYISVTASRLRPIESVNADFASSYAVAGRVDVASDNQPRTFTIGQEDLEVEVVLRTAPRTSLDAFVTAKLTYKGDGPLPPGDLRLYRDGAFLREGFLQTLIPDEEIELGFGVDQSLIVAWVDEGGATRETGVIGRNTEISEDHRFTALNRHDGPFTVEIVDRRPIPQDDDIAVRISPDATPPDEEGFKDAPGVVVWRRQVAPGETFAVRNAFTITYPSNQILFGR